LGCSASVPSAGDRLSGLHAVGVGGAAWRGRTGVRRLARMARVAAVSRCSAGQDVVLGDEAASVGVPSASRAAGRVGSATGWGVDLSARSLGGPRLEAARRSAGCWWVAAGEREARGRRENGRVEGERSLAAAGCQGAGAR
jgi:hypothetical protein